MGLHGLRPGVIVLDGKVIAAERNQTQELPDATAHAEMMAFMCAQAALSAFRLNEIGREDLT